MEWIDIWRWVKRPKGTLWVVGIAAAAVLLGGAVWHDRSPWGQTVAAWVQAFGSIFAIVGATHIADRQLREQIQRDVRTRANDQKTAAAQAAAKMAVAVEHAKTTERVVAATIGRIESKSVVLATNAFAMRPARDQLSRLDRFQADLLQPPQAMARFHFITSALAAVIDGAELLGAAIDKDTTEEEIRSNVEHWLKTTAEYATAIRVGREKLEAHLRDIQSHLDDDPPATT